MRSDVVRRLAACVVFPLLLASCYDGDPSGFRDAVVVGREGVTALSVSSPLSVLETGATLKLAAIATTATGTQDLSAEATWRSDNPSALSVDGSGTVTAHASGTARITATLGVHAGSVTLAASSAKLLAIRVEGDERLDACGGATYRAVGLYEDETERELVTRVGWSSSDADVARPDTLAGEPGRVLARQTGTASITATRDAVSSDPFIVSVQDNLDAIRLSPATIDPLDPGDVQVFTATGTWGSRQADVSRAAQWAVTLADGSTGTAIATVENTGATPGRLRAVAGGEAVLTASCGGQTAQVDVRVNQIDKLEITNARPIELKTGETLLLALEGTYSNGSTRPLNEDADWSVATVSGTGVTVSNEEGSRGRITAGSGVGVSTVKARVGGKEVSVGVTVVE